jgi:hypothetical protein
MLFFMILLQNMTFPYKSFDPSYRDALLNGKPLCDTCNKCIKQFGLSCKSAKFKPKCEDDWS